ncbi:TPA: hypothetical protein ACG3R7_000256 [Clostridioides difficile]
MWYVNTKLEVEKAIESKGFILTKWYVKAFRHMTTAMNIVHFILTMWYVNVHLYFFQFSVLS